MAPPNSQKLILRSFQSPGDSVMLTAAVRDLHAACPGRFQTDVRTSADALWEHNPHLTRLAESDRDVRVLNVHYPLIHHSNQRPYHFLHGYPQYLEQQLEVRIPVTRFHGDIHLSDEEKQAPIPGSARGITDGYWIVVAGGKRDFTAKWWNPEFFQQVVDHFQGRLRFVQCGEQDHWHPPLERVLNLVGQTTLREFVRLVYHADGVLCPVTLAMHLAAAVPSKAGKPRSRPCVVVAGGREPTHWEAYPTHRYLSTVGALPCCADGGCWKSRCQLVGDGDDKDRRNVCERPVQVSPELRIPQCMQLITPADVIRAIESYLGSGLLSDPHQYQYAPVKSVQRALSQPTVPEVTTMSTRTAPPQPTAVLFERPTDFDEAMQTSVLLQHLLHYHPAWQIDVAADHETAWLFRGCRATVLMNGDVGRAQRPYQKQIRISSKGVVSWLRDEFQLTPLPDLCQFRAQPGSSAMTAAREFLERTARGRRPILVDAALKEATPAILQTVQSCGRQAIFVDLPARRLVDERSHKTNLSRLAPLGVSGSEMAAALVSAAGFAIASPENHYFTLAASTGAVTVAVWNHKVPDDELLHFPNVVHLVAETAENAASNHNDSTLTLTARRQSQRTYTDLETTLASTIQELNDNQERRRTRGQSIRRESPSAQRNTDSAPPHVPSTRQERPASAGRADRSLPVPTAEPTSQPASSGKVYSVRFHHGLGDCAYFAHLIPLYVRRGHRIQVECTPDKAVLFRAAGAEVITSGGAQHHPWGYSSENTFVGQGHFWQGSKPGHNISEAPLPMIGDKAELWQEFCDTRLDIRPYLPTSAMQTAERWLDGLQRPVTLLHTKGNTAQQRKSLPDATTAELYRELLDTTDGTLLLLDWDNRVPRLASHRIRHLENLGACSAETLLALMLRSDLMLGVDSGPLHLARFTDIPTVGLWMPGHYPSTYTLPRREQLNVVLGEHTSQWNRYKRIPWNIVEHEGSTFTASRLARLCSQMLAAPRYLGRNNIAADVQLQQFVGEFCRCQPKNDFSGRWYWDRNRSFDVLLREAARRFESPTIVETGTIRAEEDWAGAGFFTYLAGAFLHRHGGTLDSVDLSGSNCDFARAWTAPFGEAVRVHQQDSIEFLKTFNRPVDVLYLDSLDTTEPRHAEHGLDEVKAALPKLHERSLIVFDDTPWSDGAFTGKGAQAVPWLLSQGWRILYAGYQVVLTKE